MAVLFGRRVRATIAGLTVTKPQMAFQVDREPDETPPEGALRLWNLARHHASQIYRRGDFLKLEAGYGDALGEIVSSEVERVYHQRQPTARVTVVEFGGVVSSPSMLGSVTSRAWQGQESIRQILTDIVSDDMGLSVGPLDAIPAGQTATNWAWSGRSDRALTVLTRRVGARWFDDDGVVRFARTGSAATDARSLVLSRDTGLIETPTITDRGALVVSLLQPLVRIGAGVRVDSETVSGAWTVAGFRHEGTTDAGGRFRTTMELRR